MKKLLLLSVLFCMGIVQGIAQSFTYTDENGVSWSYTKNNGMTMPDGSWKGDTTYVTIDGASNYGDEVVVPGKVVDENGTSYTITQLGSVFSGNKTITKVTLPKTVTSISNTFNGCSLLSEVVNTEQIKDCDYTFQNCNSLKNIDLSSCENLGDNAFYHCQNLQSVTLKVCKAIGGDAFSGCSNLQSIGDISSCTTIGNRAFDNCSSLKAIDISGCSSLSACVFENCTNLTSIKLPASLKEIPYDTFNGCSSLKSINLSNCTSIAGQAFYGCTNLTSVGNTALLANVSSYAFKGCSNLETINLSNCTTIEESAFSGCSKLQNVDLSKCKLLGNNTFENCKSFTEVDLSACSMLAASLFSDCNNLKTVKGLEKFSSIPNNAFSNTGLESLSLPNCTSIEESAFSNCEQLKTVDFPVCETIKQQAFKGCSNLESASLPKCKIIEGGKPQFGDSEGAFEDCKLLKTINIPACETIGKYAFSSCSNLDHVTLPNTIKELGYKCFDGNTILTLYGKEVPTLESYPKNYAEEDTLALGKYVLIIVPEEAVNAYQNANVWKSMSERIFPMGTQFSYDVSATAQPTTSGLQKAIGADHLRSVVTLKVKGSINSYDIMVMRNKMDNLHYLDLSEADVIGNSYEYYTGYCTQDSVLGPHSFADLSKLLTVKLPKSVKRINAAFNNCAQLRSVEMPEKLTRIEDGNWYGDGAFKSCGNLKEVTFHNCEYIGESAFQNCSSLEYITLPKDLKQIGNYAFSQSNLKNIILPSNVESIGNNAFYDCQNLKSVQFPPSLKSIEGSAFLYCNQLDSINLPGLTYIAGSTFDGCSNLKEVRLPSTLERIGDNAFNGCSNLNKVYAYTVMPINIDQNTFSNFKATTLYVPTQSSDNYYWSTQWGQFKEIKEFNEPYHYFYLDQDFTLEKRFDGTPDIDIKNNGSLTVDGKDNQDAGDVTIKGDENGGGSLITDGNLNAKKLRFDITVNANQWYFLSFPFDIKLSDVKTPGKYVFRRYDGSIRADQGTGGWVDLAANEEWLKQGEGYIFQSAKSGILSLSVTKDKFGQLNATDVVKDLSSYPSTDDQNASWNFIGNPQMSYMDAADLGYDSPITYWNGSNYEAVRPGDDEFALQPFQAFFVQKPANVSNIEFKAEDRQTKTEVTNKAKAAKARRIAKGITPERLIINLAVTNGDKQDKTRIVFNDKKSQAYELDCDASKFDAITDAPQLYSIEAKAGNLAINERPMGSVNLGFSTKKGGIFTLSATRMDQPMLLQDKQTGATIDLTDGNYQFSADAGTYDHRFVLVTNRSVTGVADIINKTGVNIMPTESGLNIQNLNGKKVAVYATNGTLLATRDMDGMLNLATGVYIVKVDNMTTKVMVK